MLQYEPRLALPAERPWRQVLSIAVGSVACAVGLLLWSWTAPGLWTLATFSPSGPIRPMNFVFALAVSCFGGLIACPVIGSAAAAISRRPAARFLAALGVCAGLLPALNLVLFFVIIHVRQIPLAG